MAIIRNGLAGLIEASQLKDKRTSLYKLIHNIKKERVKSLKPPTEAQQKQQLKFKLMALFISHLKELTKISYLFRNKNLTTMNVIARQILIDRIIGEYPDFKIDYSSIKLSSGRLFRVYYPYLTVKTKGKLRVKWENDDGNRDDDVVVFIYNETKNTGFYLMNVAKRSDLKVDIQLENLSKKDVLHGWIILTDHRNRQISDSVYMSHLKD